MEAGQHLSYRKLRGSEQRLSSRNSGCKEDGRGCGTYSISLCTCIPWLKLSAIQGIPEPGKRLCI